MIKRSSRAGDLKEKFKVKRCRRYRLWKCVGESIVVAGGWRRNIFLLEVARTNKLELLKWAREEKKCEWDEMTINAAAIQGNLEMVKYCVAKKCPIDAWACESAARTVISRYSNTYAKKSKRLGIRVLPIGG